MRPPPPLLALVAGVAQQVWTRPAPPSPVRRAVAAATAAASFGLAGAAASRFRRIGTTLEPMDPSKATSLVVSGPNAVTRNPMYVGLAGMLAANAIRLRDWRALLPLAAFVAFLDRFQVAAEERALAATFGADYDAYRAAVPRWIGARSVRQRMIRGRPGHGQA
jgi:protein-S-isoprenylcysteine O-methyltransferase Ste14